MIDSPPDLVQNEDEAFPSLAALAGRQAYERTLKSGQRVLIAQAGVLYEVSPGGERRILRQLSPPVPVRVGYVLKLW